MVYNVQCFVHSIIAELKNSSQLFCFEQLPYKCAGLWRPSHKCGVVESVGRVLRCSPLWCSRYNVARRSEHLLKREDAYYCVYMFLTAHHLLSPWLLRRSNLNRDGIRKRTLSLGFLGIISRVLRLEVSTLVFCLSTMCYSWTNFIDWLFCINFWNHRGTMVFCQVFLLCLHQ